MTTIEDIRFPTPDEIEGFWPWDKMHAPRPIHPLSQDLVMATLAIGFTRAQAEYDCPIVAECRAINHYFYNNFHPHDDPAVVADRMSRYRDTLDAKVPLVGKRWIAEWFPMIRTRNEAERGRRLLGPERRGVTCQIRRHDRVDDGDVVRPRPHQLRVVVRRGAVRHVPGGHAAGRPDRVVPDPARSPHPSRRRRPRPVGPEPDRQAQPDALGRVRRDRDPRPAGQAGPVRGRPEVPRGTRQVPIRLRVAQRRRVRPRRCAVAREPGDPAQCASAATSTCPTATIR